MSEETTKQFLQRIELFQKGFEAITKSINDSLTKITTQTQKMAENTSFMPKIVESNKDIKKSAERLSLIVEGLMGRLDKIMKNLNL
jgi:hypothetical protein